MDNVHPKSSDSLNPRTRESCFPVERSPEYFGDFVPLQGLGGGGEGVKDFQIRQ